MKNLNKSASPIILNRTDMEGNRWDYSTAGGLTKRELVAAMALQGMLANSDTVGSLQNYAEQAAAFADALLARLKGTQGK